MPKDNQIPLIPDQELSGSVMKSGMLSKVACGIILIDPQTHQVIDINETAVAILGVPYEEILNHSCVSFACFGVADNCPFSAYDNPEDQGGKYLVQKQDGAVPVIRAFSEIIFDGKRLIVECLIDISGRKQAEIELKHHENLLRAIYENASVGMAILDMNGNFFKVNQALCDMLHYTEEELLSRAYTVTHPDDLERSEYILAQLKAGKINKNIMEKRYVRKDGSIIYALQNVSLIRDNLGAPSLFIIQAQDITYIKNALSKAVESDHLKTTFLQNLSHEIRTPANAILGFYELMKDPICSLEERVEYIDIIKKGIESFVSILNNIVDISKIETRQLTLKKGNIDIMTMLKEVFMSYSTKFNTNKLEGIEFSFFMLETYHPVIIQGDEFRLKQTLEFLLDNAFKFTKFGRITLGCHVIPEKEVILFVKDSGIGIPKDKQEYIFNKFRQGDESNTREYGGLGLGLTLAHEFIALHGGKLWLQSGPGKGTQVYCSLPYTGKYLAPEKNQATNLPIKIIDLTGSTILIAEDTENNYAVLERLLKRANAKVIWARNGLEAIEISRRESAIDLILMDLQMPIVNGYDATQEILNFRPGLPIIAQTAYSIDFSEQHAKEIGCVAYFSKPLDITSLFATIKKHVSKDPPQSGMIEEYS